MHCGQRCNQKSACRAAVVECCAPRARLPGQSRHAGAPLQLVFRKKATIKALRETLTSVRVASVHLHRGIALNQPTGTAAVMAALERSVSTLTALHGLPMRTGHHLGLAPFSQLRALTLRGTRYPPDFLRASDLPVSLREITFDGAETPGCWRSGRATLPWFPNLCRHRGLRRVTLTNYEYWQLGTWDDAAEQPVALQLPPSLEVCAVSPVPVTHVTAALRSCPSFDATKAAPHNLLG